MLLMTEDEARSIMKTHGWGYRERPRSLGQKYLYAQRRVGKRRVERYICPLSQLGKLTEKKLVAILAPTLEPIEETSSKENNNEPEAPDTPNSP